MSDPKIFTSDPNNIELRPMAEPDNLIWGKGAFQFKADQLPNGSYHIVGKASTDGIDLENEVVEPGFADDSMDEFMQHPLMLFMHNFWDLPVGKWTEITVHDHYLEAEGYVLPTATGKDIMLLSDAGILNSLSIGFTVEASEKDEETGLRTITKGRLYEISIVNLGMNPDALYEPIKQGIKDQSIDIDIKSLIGTGGDEGGRLNNRRIAMSTNVAEMHDLSKKVDDLNKQHGDALEKTQGSITTLTTDLDKLKAEIVSKVEDVKTGLAPVESLTTLQTNIAKDFGEVNEKINKLQNARDIGDRQTNMLAWMGKLVQNRGKQKMDIILRAPVDYKSHPEGELLKALRHQYDTAYAVDAYMRGRGYGNYGGIKTLESWKAFTDLLEFFAPDEVKAMASGSAAGYGLEWVSTGWSAVMHDIYDMERKLERYIPHFEMPTMNYEWPALTAHGVAYPVTEATTNNPDQMRKSDWTTSKITFAAQDFGVAYAISANLLEDSIIAIAPIVQNELMFALASAMNDAILNGNDDATVDGETWTNDLDTGYTTWALSKCKSLITGLRLYASDLSATIDFGSGSAGIGDGATTFGPKDTMSLLVKMGKHAAEADKVKFVMPLVVYLKHICMDAMAKPGDYGGQGTYNTSSKQLYFAGIEMIIDPDFSTEMTAAGIYDGSTKTKTAELAFKPSEFKIGNHRPITVEYNKNIHTQQWGFVATMRKTMEKMAPSAEFPVALGYNITTAGL